MATNIKRWWEETGAASVEALIATADAIVKEDEPRFAQYLRNARLYGGKRFETLVGLGRQLAPSQDDQETIRLNVVASCVDTAVAKLIKNRPAPQFVTNGADWKTRRKAERLNKFGKGVLDSSGFYEGAPRGLREAAIFGTTATKMVEEDGAVCAEPVYPWELLVEQAEAARMKPRTLIQRTWADRAAVTAAFGDGPGKSDRLAKIRNSKAEDRTVGAAYSLGRERGVDQIEVFEGWRLPNRDGKGGRHIICVRGGELESGAWEHEAFPFAFLRWEDPLVGFWGVGIPERLTGIQFEINQLLQKIQTAFHLLGVPRVFIDSASGVPVAHINNDIGAIIRTAPGASPPVVVAPQTIHPEVFAHLSWLYQRAFDEVGISQLSAQSRKPAGLDSGVALREFTDIESERFVPQGRKIENWHLEAVERAIDVAKGIEGFTVDVADRRYREEIRWSDVEIERKSYSLQCFPVSLLPQTPAGRLERVQELIASQMVTKERGMEMLDVPDLDETMQIMTASSKHVRRLLGKILDGEDAPAVDPNLNIAGALEQTLGVYNEACADGAPEEILDQLRAFKDQLANLAAEAAKAAQAAAGPPAAMMAPGAPPAQLAA